jgi:transcriptional regulator with XRE-family HTH domain
VSVPSQTLQALAETVRTLRSRKRWSLAMLAERSHVSRGMLRQIEAARTNPSIGTLIQVANAFGVGVWQLFSVGEQQVKTAAWDEALVLWRTRRGSKARLLVGVDQPQPVELWTWDIAPGDIYHAPAHTRNTLEAIHVRQGTLSFTLGQTTIPIPARHSVVARMDRRHAYANEGRTRVLFDMTVIDPAR